MPKKLDISGHRYGRLTAIKYIRRDHHYKSIWLFECDCKKKKEIDISQVRSGKTKSCGCLHDEVASTNNKTHGLSSHPLFNIWCDIRKRCYNKKSNNYKNYGGRGIKVYKKWLDDFQSFYDWSINNGWKKELEIDRIDNKNHYKPSNCRFVTSKENCNNRRTTHLVVFNGKKQSITQWSEELNIPRKTLSRKINKGLSLDRIIAEYVSNN